jgi:4-hydroxy-3-polyprenylbenzoate decarboxylase
MIRDLRTWLSQLDAEGELYRLNAKVDWRGEIAEIQRQVVSQQGPAILYNNILDYERGRCTRLFCGGQATLGRTALMLDLPKTTPRREMIDELRRRLRHPVESCEVERGPVKEVVVSGGEIDLYELPVPRWHPLDQDRYINTWCGVVTRDPETGRQNVGVYRGAVGGRNQIKVWLVPAQNWGVHYRKYQAINEPMPVAFVYGWDPVMVFTGALSLPLDEYRAMGAIAGDPVPLVRCETSNLTVPASAELVIEGVISPDPLTYQVEGPFGESSGYYSDPARRPVVDVKCLTHRTDPIFRGAIGESLPTMSVGAAALIWNMLEQQDIPGIRDVALGPVLAVKIHKTYQGQARQVAAAIWGSRLGVNMAKVIVVVDDEKDIDIADPAQVQAAIVHHVDPTRGLVVFPMQLGGAIDPSLSSDAQDVMEYGQALINKVLIDATIDWVTHPRSERWGGRRLSPDCMQPAPEVKELVGRRWQEYGIPTNQGA